MQRAVFAFDQDAVGKFQRTVDHKQNFVRRAELDDGVLKEDGFVFVGAPIAVAVAIAVAIAIARVAAEFDGDPYRRGSGKETGQAAYNV